MILSPYFILHPKTISCGLKMASVKKGTRKECHDSNVCMYVFIFRLKLVYSSWPLFLQMEDKELRADDL